MSTIVVPLSLRREDSLNALAYALADPDLGCCESQQQGAEVYMLELLRLCARADAPHLERLALAYPVEVAAWRWWLHAIPAPAGADIHRTVTKLRRELLARPQ